MKFEIKTWRGYLVVFFLLLISYFFIFFIVQKIRTESRWMAHSYQVINTLHTLKGELIDAETGVRGFMITKEKAFLQPYYNSQQNLSPLFTELKNLTTDNESYKAELDELGSLLTRRMESLQVSLEQFEMNNQTLSPEILSRRNSNKTMVDSARLIIQRLISQEQILRTERTRNLQSFFLTTTIAAVIAFIISILTVVYSLINYLGKEKAKRKADDHAESYRIELENRVKELGLVNRELKELKSIEKFASTGRIARTIAHEVRNPLTNIFLATEQLRDYSEMKEESQDLLQMITRNANRINVLVSDLLQSTRFGQLNYDKISINYLLEATLVLAQDRFDLKNVKIEKHFSEDICDIRVDAEKMKLAFLNIITNAIESMENEPRLFIITTYTEENKCVIEFKDNGSGMDEETLQRLFEPYFTTKQKGSGLGLTNTQNVIFNHQGNIQVASKPGVGTTFTIKLNFN